MLFRYYTEQNTLKDTKQFTRTFVVASAEKPCLAGRNAILNEFVYQPGRVTLHYKLSRICLSLRSDLCRANWES
ncbi:hypothetical protein AC249_AIPGENE4174 [Exaiptasia diaphana]|nr:hypothetical protein AC249_AIPGENE4174 [Exaiptasia diaphana]